MTHYVYIIECADTTLYIGATNNLEKRLVEHNVSTRGARYTRARRPVILKYLEAFSSLKEARAREAQLKRWPRAQKLALFA